jgi:hypothetical protein
MLKSTSDPALVQHVGSASTFHAHHYCCQLLCSLPPTSLSSPSHGAAAATTTITLVHACLQSPGFLLLRDEFSDTIFFLPPDESGQLMQVRPLLLVLLLLAVLMQMLLLLADTQNAWSFDKTEDASQLWFRCMPNHATHWATAHAAVACVC